MKIKIDGEASPSISIDLIEGDDIEEVATRINGQSNGRVNASVTEEGKLQIFSDEGSIEIDGTTKLAQGVDAAGTAADIFAAGATSTLTTVQEVDVKSVGGAQSAVSVIDAALKYIDSQRADLGAKQNRLGHTINNLANVSENVSQSNSRIRDTDFAKETTEMTKSQILQQASTSILAQAKQVPQAAMTLLQ